MMLLVIGWWFIAHGPAPYMMPEGLSVDRGSVVGRHGAQADIRYGPYLTQKECEQIAEQLRDDADLHGRSVAVSPCYRAEY